MVDVLDVAKYMVYLSYRDNVNDLTPLRVQKLLYLAQGWSYVWDNKPLFDDSFEAWQYGPVNVYVYNYFRKYNRRPIPYDEGILSLDDTDAEDTINAVWREYSRYGIFRLVELTHSQDPWKNAYNSGSCIQNEDIKEYFQSTYG